MRNLTLWLSLAASLLLAACDSPTSHMELTASTLPAPTGVTGVLAGAFTMNWLPVVPASGYNIRCAANDAALTSEDASDPTMITSLPTVNGGPLTPNSVTTYPVPGITAGMSCEVGSWACTATGCTVSVPSVHVIASGGSSSSSGGSSSSSSSGSSSSSSSGSGLPACKNGNQTYTETHTCTNCVQSTVPAGMPFTVTGSFTEVITPTCQ